MADAEQYAEDTASTLFYLQLESLGVRDSKMDHIASHLGKVCGLGIFLRSIPFHAARDRCHIPSQQCAQYEVSAEDLIRYLKSRLSSSMQPLWYLYQLHISNTCT